MEVNMCQYSLHAYETIFFRTVNYFAARKNILPHEKIFCRTTAVRDSHGVMSLRTTVEIVTLIYALQL